MNLFKLLLAALVCSFGFASVAPAQDRGPASDSERIIRDFYHWYVQALLANKDPLKKNRSELKRFATDRLIREIDGMVQGPDGLGGDPFVDAQDFDKDWATNISVSKVASTGSKATAQVQLKGSEMGTRALNVRLVQERGGWKVGKVKGLE